MKQVGAVLVLAVLLGGCAASPSVNRTKTTLGEINMDGLECRRDKPPGSSIPRTICASPDDWANYEKDQKAKTQAMLDRARDQEDNRRLYTGMKSN